MSDRIARITTALIVVAALDLFVILVTGTTSPLLLGRIETGAWGVAARAATLLGLIWLRYGLRRRRRPAPQVGVLVLLSLLLPTLVHFHVGGGRLNGDGLSYYVFVRSLNKDRDFDLTNEYTHYGMIDRGDLQVLTDTGLRRSIYSIGPAICWTPFFVAGEGLARLESWLGRDVDLSGYGPHHRNAVALGGLLYGFAAILLIHSLLRRHFRPFTALLAALLAWLATFVHWYMVWQPTYSHGPSACLAAYVIWLWDRDRGSGRDAWGYFYLGAILGLAMCVRWQNGVLLVLPGLELLRALLREPRTARRLVGLGALCGAGVLIGAFPQMAAWKALYDMWLLTYPPHGADFVRLDHPWILNTLFSSRHGLLSWTPVLWGGYLGFWGLLFRRRSLALPLLPPLLIMTYVNFCAGDWWAGASFSNRRFDSLIPILSLGLAVSIDIVWSWFRRRPALALVSAAAPFLVWNVTLAEQVHRGMLPRDQPVAFQHLARGSAQVVSEAVGFPTTWPASWGFARRHRLGPDQYDLAVGKYLFYRQNNLGGHIELGAPGDEALLGEGWSRRLTHAGRGARRLDGRARLLAPLDVPLDLELSIRSAAAGESAIVRVLVNDVPAGQFLASSEWGEHRIRTSRAFWRRELNDVVIETDGTPLFVDAVVFARVGG